MFDFFERFAEENDELIKRRIEEADGDLALATRTVAVDMMRDEDYPEASFLVISGSAVIAIAAVSFAAGVVVGVAVD